MTLQKVLLYAFAATSLTACENKASTPTSGAAAPTTAAQIDPEKPAAEKVKLTLAFQPHADLAAFKPNAEKLAAFLSEQSGYEIAINVPETHGDEIDAMRRNKAQLAWYSGWAYLKAHMAADADLLLAETIDGKPTHASKWYAAKDRKIGKLTDLRGKKVAFTDPSSAAGFLLPYAKLVEEGVVKQGEDLNKAFKDVFFAGSDADALAAVAAGKADAAAVSGQAFEALPPEQQEQLTEVSEQGPAPNRVLAVRADMKPEIREAVKKAFIELNKPEHDALRKSALGAEALAERSHGDHVTGLSEAQELIGTEFPLPPRKQ